MCSRRLAYLAFSINTYRRWAAACAVRSAIIAVFARVAAAVAAVRLAFTAVSLAGIAIFAVKGSANTVAAGVYALVIRAFLQCATMARTCAFPAYPA